jgi:hypothetical protein
MSEIFIYDLTDTWNNSGNVFDAIKMDVTNTASASGSKLLNLQVGGVEKFTVDIDGVATGATATSGDNSTKLATTAFVQDAFSSFQFDISNVTATWNDAGTVFTGIGLDVTDTASDASSLLMDLQVGGASKLRVFKNGLLNINDTTAYVTAGPSYSSGIHIGSNAVNTVPVSIQQGYGISLKSDVSLRWCQSAVNSTADVSLERESAGVLKVTDGSTGDGQLKVGRITTTDTRLDTTATELNFALSGLPVVGIGLQYLGLNQNSDIRWSNSTTDPTSSGDIGLTRDSAGVLKVTDGSTGYGDLLSGPITVNSPDVNTAAITINSTFSGVDNQYLYFKNNNDQTAVLHAISGRLRFGVNDSAGGTPREVLNIIGSGHELLVNQDAKINWRDTAGDSWSSAGSADVGLARDSAGVLKVTDGSTGDAAIRARTVHTEVISGAYNDGISGFSPIKIGTDSAPTVVMGGSGAPYGVAVRATGDFSWTNDPNSAGVTRDLSLLRDSAGVLKISDGSTGYGKIVADGYQLNNPINSQTGTTYTAAVADAERYVQLDNAAAITVTVPSDTTANLPIGATVTFEQTGAGTVTFAADSGVTINSRGAVLSTAGQFAVATIIKTASNTFTLTGDLV